MHAELKRNKYGTNKQQTFSISQIKADHVKIDSDGNYEIIERDENVVAEAADGSQAVILQNPQVLGQQEQIQTQQQHVRIDQQVSAQQQQIHLNSMQQ